MQKEIVLEGWEDEKYEHNEGKPKTLPIKTIAALVFILFIILVIGFMILPAYFDFKSIWKTV